MHGIERLDGVVDGGDTVAELVERVLLALHGGLRTSGTNSLKALSDLGGIGSNDRAIGTTRLANHRGGLDVHELVVLLELAVVAALGLGLGQDTRLLKERNGLIGNKGGQGVGRGLVVGKAALLGLNGPLVGVAIAGKEDALVVGQDLLAVLERGVLELILGRTLKRVGEGLERLGHGGIEHQVGVGDVLLGAAGTELELVAGEGKREVRLRSVLSCISLGRVSAPRSSTPRVAWTEALPSMIFSTTSVSWSPRKMDIIAGGASLAPRR